MWKVILISLFIASLEYYFQVPVNRIGNLGGLFAGQLKVTQEVITLVVIVIIARLYPGEKMAWNL